MSTPVTNEVILASAGSGKTFRLSDRVIRLLAQDAQPEQIVALTFTRAAAAEFAAKTLAKLAEAATDPAQAHALGLRLDLPNPQTVCRRLLRTTVLSMHRMTLGTLDSFFARLVASYPTEIGLDGQPVRLLDDAEQKRIRRQLITRLVRETPADQLDELWTSLRALQAGRDTAEPLRRLEEQIESLHGLFTVASAADRWNLPPHLRGAFPSWGTPATAEEIAAAAGTFAQWLGRQSFHARFRQSLKDLVQAFAGMEHASDLDSTQWDNIGGRLLPLLTAPEGAAASVEYSGKPITFPADVVAAYRVLARHAHGLSLRGAYDETRALHHLLSRYEQLYAAEVRQRGRVTFSDYVTLLLAAEEKGTKLDLDYRLDCQIRHWLFDEFQDTSTAQWQVLRNNLEEAAADADTWRTSFFVGDLKQSLYSWRGGNSELLRRVSEDPRWHGGSAPTRLDTTRRCSAPVVELVNTLLGDLVPHGNYFSPAAAQRWSEVFRPHTSSAQHPALGETRWVQLRAAEADDEEQDSVTAQANWIAADLRAAALVEGPLLKPGLTCAILVSSNDQAAKITDALRKCGIEAADEAQTSVATDNPFTAGLTALVALAAHPADALSRGLVQMAPTATRFVAAEGGWLAAPRRLAATFLAGGAEAVVQAYLAHAQLAGDTNAIRFLRKRQQQLLNLAVAFDQSGERRLEALTEYLQASEQRDGANPRAVQVLTIHRAKGLEYTVVYLPCLNNPQHKLVDVRTQLPLISTNPEDLSPDWILCRPQEATSRLDPAGLGRVLETEIADSAYESLCKFYVGMTRAIRRLVLITTELSRSVRDDWGTPELHGKYDCAMLVEAVLGKTGFTPTELNLPGVRPGRLRWQSGTHDWLTAVENRAKPPAALRPLPAFAAASRLVQLRPSQADQSFSGRWHPPATTSTGREFGTRVHEMLQHLEWDCPSFLRELNAAAASDADPARTDAIATIEHCLNQPAVAALLRRPSPDALLWREQPALLRHDGKMISAMFDRVQITPGREAVVIDYKTNVGEPEDLRGHYREQMRLYRTSVAKLCQLAEANVRCVLIHVRTGTLVEV
jgi:ATP-dependent exoDNAse (exonuclease V) beta subunit